jgi:hypothetical protein
MVTELMIRIKVIKLTKARGTVISPMKGKLLKTSFGLGHELEENRIDPYEIRNAPKVKASLIRKYHIMSFPYSTLKGLLPPLHHF